MPVLSSTSLVPVSTGSDLYLYYQKDTSLFEASSKDGVSWQLNKDAIVNGLRSWGSPFTAFYNPKDPSQSNKDTIHLFYVTSENKLVHQFKYVSETKWTPVPSDVIAAHQPTNTSRICSGAGAVVAGPQLNHQFVYYETQDDKGILDLTEVWRQPQGPWHISTVLKSGKDQEPGSDLACIIKSAYLHVFFQNHAGDIKLWENINGWQDKGISIKGADVSHLAVIAAASVGPSEEDKEHLVFPASGNAPTIKHLLDGKVIDTKVQFYSGTRLGLVGHKSKIILFYVGVHTSAITTFIYDAGAWKEGGKVE